MPFSKKSPCSVCILFANGTISDVAFNQPGSSGSNFTYEGRFEILQLTHRLAPLQSMTKGVGGDLVGSISRLLALMDVLLVL